jgi:hypothetical protein
MTLHFIVYRSHPPQEQTENNSFIEETSCVTESSTNLNPVITAKAIKLIEQF